MNDNRFDTKDAHKLDSAIRVGALRPYELLTEIAEVTRGMVCVDFGSGTGTFALPMADLAGPEGRVYAVDNSAEMIGHIQAKNPPSNLITLQREVEQTGLESQIADLCLLACILHEVKQPENLIAEAFRLLKPEGRLVVVDWRADVDSIGPPLKIRLSRERIEQLCKQSGFKLLQYVDWSENHYAVTASK